MSYVKKSEGVAPLWQAVDLATTDFTPTGKCIGFFVTVAGDVKFVSGGNTLTVPFDAKQFVSADVTTFIKTGTTATGIYALYVK